MPATLELRHFQYLFVMNPYVCPLCILSLNLVYYIHYHPLRAHCAFLSNLSSPGTCLDHVYMTGSKFSLVVHAGLCQYKNNIKTLISRQIMVLSRQRVKLWWLMFKDVKNILTCSNYYNPYLFLILQCFSFHTSTLIQSLFMQPPITLLNIMAKLIIRPLCNFHIISIWPQRKKRTTNDHWDSSFLAIREGL